jgi:uroporphyrinogen-III synthase
MDMVQVAVTSNLTEAEEIQTILRSAGIESELRPAVEHHPSETDDVATKVLVHEKDLDAAQDAVEALTDPGEMLGEA